MSSKLWWLFLLNPGAWRRGEHLAIWLLRLLSLAISWVSACVPGVTRGSGYTAYVRAKDGRGRTIYREEVLLWSCQAFAMELFRRGSQRPRRVDYICKKGPAADVWPDSGGAPDWCDVNFIVFFFWASQGAPVFWYIVCSIYIWRI